MKRLSSNVIVFSDLLFTNDSSDHLNESNARKNMHNFFKKQACRMSNFIQSNIHLPLVFWK